MVGINILKVIIATLLSLIFSLSLIFLFIYLKDIEKQPKMILFLIITNLLSIILIIAFTIINYNISESVGTILC